MPSQAVPKVANPRGSPKHQQVLGSSSEAQHIIPSPARSQLPGAVPCEHRAALGTREVEVGQLCSHSIPRHPGHAKRCPAGKLSCALRIIPATEGAAGFRGTGFTLSGAGALGDGRRSRQVWDQVEEDFVLSWEEGFCVFLTHLPLSFPWKTSTLSTAPVPSPEEPFWQPGAAGKAALDASRLPTLEPTESHRRGEGRKSLWIFFPLLKTSWPPSVTTSPCPQERCPTPTIQG